MTSPLWPELPLTEWADTYETLHMWTQIVGKIRAAHTPLVNHWWNVTLYVTPRGLTTWTMFYAGRPFQIDFDFVDHRLIITTSGGIGASIALKPRSVADFYQEVMGALGSLGIPTKIRTLPDEVPKPIAFELDHEHASYDPEYANRFWRILLQVDRVFNDFRARFIGKCSPVHFFWGSFDLAVTRFSGRRAPERPGADLMTREAYSHEVISHGFWPGGPAFPEPAFYSYTAPTPAGLGQEPISPKAAFYSEAMGEFFLKYEDVRTAASPDEPLLEFMQTTYEAGAKLANWDRLALEREVVLQKGTQGD
jgi:hypothetical protein